LLWGKHAEEKVATPKIAADDMSEQLWFLDWCVCNCSAVPSSGQDKAFDFDIASPVASLCSPRVRACTHCTSHAPVLCSNLPLFFSAQMHRF
jgi:hypothetical protein